MLVEDDNNLREIYEARLLAEGYEIVSARDGEEALALAVKEKPDLIISDVMMPKISGFDMLDILRGTQETKNTKVVMMTALSQAEDKNRAEKLGADRYLVKSQVTLEDVARVAREVLEGTTSPSSSGVVSDDAATTGGPITPPVPAAPTIPAAPVTTPQIDLSSLNIESTGPKADSALAQTNSNEEDQINKQINDFVASVNPPTPDPMPPTPTAPPLSSPPQTDTPTPPAITTDPTPQLQPSPSNNNNDAPISGGPPRPDKLPGDDSPPVHKKVISPTGQPLDGPNLDDLLAKEGSSGTLTPPSPPPSAPGPNDPSSIAL